MERKRSSIGAPPPAERPRLALRRFSHRLDLNLFRYYVQLKIYAKMLATASSQAQQEPVDLSSKSPTLLNNNHLKDSAETSNSAIDLSIKKQTPITSVLPNPIALLPSQGRFYRLFCSFLDLKFSFFKDLQHLTC